MKFFNRMFADVVIKITDHQAQLIKGKLSPSILREFSLLASDSSTNNAEIWINTMGKITFSKEIKTRFHQRFRNVLSQ